MPSNYPNGVTSFGVPVFGGTPLIPTTVGKVFFVSSLLGNDSNAGTDPGTPLATTTAALALCSATTADVIILMPGHVETLATAGALTISKAGVSIIGLGNAGQRPKYTLSATASTIAVTAANVLIRNIQITVSIDAVVKCFNVTAAGLWLDMVDYVDTTSCALEQFIFAPSTATDMQVTNCRWVCTGTVSAATQQWILLNAAHRFRCINCFAALAGMTSGNPANGVIVGVTAASLDVQIINNVFEVTTSTGSIGISLLASTTGMVSYNHVATPKTAIAGNVGIASCYGANNYSSHVVNKNGILDPVVDS